MLGAIQIIRDIILGDRGLRLCHQITHTGEGGGQPKCQFSGKLYLI